ncbi:MAG: hypothetical protein MI919_24795 [Holophagales bacterium]|nr:hypothetical protein [Holophagales bacterium]
MSSGFGDLPTSGAAGDSIDRHLDRAAARGSRWRSCGGCLLVLCVGALAILLFGLAFGRGWLEDSEVPAATFLVIAGTLVAGVAVAMAGRRRRKDRRWVAGRLEASNPALLDRLTTLSHGGGRSGRWSLGLARRSAADTAPSVPEPYRERIAHQAARELEWASDPFERERRWFFRLLPLFVLLLVLAWHFFATVLPEWQIETWRQQHRQADAAALDLDSPLADAAEVGRDGLPWGEVRITHPGRDLKVTKVDVVPLQIEAAASRPLDAAHWQLARTGEEAQVRPLELPFAPRAEGGVGDGAEDDARRYAVFRPVLYVDELYLSDWDVVSYWAEAADEGERSYRSEIYFLEVRPFRQEIEKLPGGQGGAAYSSLSQLSGLIDGQKRVLKETHRHLGRASRLLAEQRRQEQAKLAAAERDLFDAARIFYAELASRDHQAVAPILDHLALAAEHLEVATEALEHFVADAVEPEQQALAELVAARKGLQKAISENPEAFDGSGLDDDPEPIAELPKELDQIAELHDAHAAARELVERARQEQQRARRELEEGAAGDGDRLGELGRQQGETAEELADFVEQHPRVFEGLERRAEEAAEALDEAAGALEQAADDAGAGEISADEILESGEDGDIWDSDDLLEERQARLDRLQGDAGAALDELAAGLERSRGRQELQDLERLRRLLEAQERQLDAMAREPESSDGRSRDRAAEGARRLAESLADAVRTEAGREVLEDGVRDATSPDARRQLDRAMGRLQRSSGGQDTADAAASGRDALGRMGDAFDASLPEATRKSRRGDPLAGSEGGELDQALARIRSMARGEAGPEGPEAGGAETGGEGEPARRTGRASPEARADALDSLRRAMEAEGLTGGKASDLLVEAERVLVAEGAVDGEALRRLVDGIELLRIELAEAAVEEEPVDLVALDPERLPAEYRERIQRYLVELSERRGAGERREGGTEAGGSEATEAGGTEAGGSEAGGTEDGGSGDGPG